MVHTKNTQKPVQNPKDVCIRPISKITMCLTAGMLAVQDYVGLLSLTVILPADSAHHRNLRLAADQIAAHYSQESVTCQLHNVLSLHPLVS